MKDFCDIACPHDLQLLNSPPCQHVTYRIFLVVFVRNIYTISCPSSWPPSQIFNYLSKSYPQSDLSAYHLYGPKTERAFRIHTKVREGDAIVDRDVQRDYERRKKKKIKRHKENEKAKRWNARRRARTQHIHIRITNNNNKYVWKINWMCGFPIVRRQLYLHTHTHNHM